jgi:hypothetical protein
MPYSLLLGILFLFLFLLLLNLLGQRPLREFFVDIKTDPDVQAWIDFQNNQFCPLWTELIEIGRKNDQVDKPKDQQLNFADYCKQLEGIWSVARSKKITFVKCDVPVTKDMPLSKLLPLVPEGSTPYIDSLQFLYVKMGIAIKQVDEALENEGFTPFAEGFDDMKTTTCTSSDGTTTTTTVPKTPEEQKQEADQTLTLMTRIKAIMKDRDTIMSLMTMVRQQKTRLDEIKKRADDDSLYSKDGAVPTLKQYGPPNGRLFFD